MLFRPRLLKAKPEEFPALLNQSESFGSRKLSSRHKHTSCYIATVVAKAAGLSGQHQREDRTRTLLRLSALWASFSEDFPFVLSHPLTAYSR